MQTQKVFLIQNIVKILFSAIKRSVFTCNNQAENDQDWIGHLRLSVQMCYSYFGIAWAFQIVAAHCAAT